MDKNLEGLNAEELYRELYGKELNTKKNILEYIEIIKILKKEPVDVDKIQDTYNFIYNNIEKLKASVKPNTIMYLQNQLKAQLGKFVVDKEPKIENSFIEFFKEAYPSGERRKDFTWVLMDINSITNEQIWTTLKYVNRECLNNDLILVEEDIEDIIEVIKILIARNDVKYINQIKSLDTLMNELNIKIVSKDNKFKLINKK